MISTVYKFLPPVTAGQFICGAVNCGNELFMQRRPIADCENGFLLRIKR